MFKIKLFVLIILATMIALPVLASNHETATSTQLIPTGFETVCGPDAEGGLAGCINRIYLLSLGIGSIFAVLMIVLAGYKYMTAQGNSQQVENAKESFASAFIGLIVLFIAFILLNAINPDLVRFRNFEDITSSLPIPGEATVTMILNPRNPRNDQNVVVSWVVTENGPRTIKSCEVNMTGPLPAGTNTRVHEIGSSKEGPITIDSSKTVAGTFSVELNCTDSTGAAVKTSKSLTVSP